MASRKNPFERLALAGQPPQIITFGVSILTGSISGLLLILLGWLDVLPPRAFGTAALAWAAGIALTATLSYSIGGSIWGPYSWLHRVIDLISEGDFNLPAEPAKGAERHLRSGLRQIAEELERYRGLRIDALILEKNELEAIVNSLADGLIVTDLEFRPVLINPALRQMAQPGTAATLRLDESDPFFGRWGDPDQRLRIEAGQRSAPAAPRTDVVELDRPKQFLKRYSTPLYNAEGILIGFLALYHDITPEIEADRLKSDFIANASHELRTPVTSLKVLVESLLDGAQDVPELRQTFLEDILREIDRMHALVNDLLDLAALEAKNHLKIQEIDAVRVIHEAVATVQPQAKQREIRLELELAAAHLPLWADRVRVRQILVNLLSNAVKFTPNGGRVVLAASDTGEGVRFQVRDSGIGIPAQDLPHIFDRFFRVTRGRSRLQGGSGLGLTLVKQAVDAHQGRVSVESTEGEGTAFTLWLPHPAPGPATPGVASLPAARKPGCEEVFPEP